ncbi:7-methylguanosine phosphate-specific 5'-nucleotidase [Copidosoma floridanum]|uniref:7-methylguanosine phosphate-specific 5'-nucleotidase n=1 Tax=Copidosoma floridanum TaxID=29053 RepID=UPI0006C9DAAE|nr:7-methylguanosine phosphate-specific 5'-nucleotidase [Copidosoma floridanum]
MSDELTLENMLSLRSTNVYMKDRVTVLQKINKIIRDGANKLQLVADFDRTLTKQHENGVPFFTSAGIFEQCKQLPEFVKKEAEASYEKYRAIEINPNIPLEEKVKAMEDWYASKHNTFKGIPFDKKEIDEVTKKYGNSLRDRTKELFTKLNALGVPILIFSAGFGDVIKIQLEQQEVYMDNINLISNFFKFNGKILEGFENPQRLIHPFNKNEHALENEYFKIIQGRVNVVLLGDAEGDATMADGVKDTETILRIGFLYDHVEKCLPSYQEAFDIVLVDDQTMNVVLDILNPLF